MQNKNDLTHGTIWKKLLLFFLPIAAGTCIQQLYNTVDALIVGRFVGTVALAAVGGSASQLTNTIVNFFVASTSGAAVIIAQFFGAGDKEKLKKASGNILAVCAAIGVVVGLLVVIFSDSLLRLLDTPEETLREAGIYLRIYFMSMPFIVLLNMESAIVRALGDSRSPFIFMIESCITNIILDYVFVVYFGWGVVGVAVATVVSILLNFSLVTRLMLTTDRPYKLDVKTLSLKGDDLGRMLLVGIPSGLQSVMYGFSNIIIQAGVNGLGTIAVASWTMTGKVEGVFWAICGAVGSSITTFIAQNYGAGNKDRIKGCVKQGLIMSELITLIIVVGILGLGMPALKILTEDKAVQDLTYELLWYFVPFYFAYMIIEVFSGVLRGTGDTINSLIITGIGICLFRIVWVFFVYPRFGTIEVLSLCFGFSWILTAIVMVIYYKKAKWMKLKD